MRLRGLETRCREGTPPAPQHGARQREDPSGDGLAERHGVGLYAEGLRDEESALAVPPKAAHNLVAQHEDAARLRLGNDLREQGAVPRKGARAAAPLRLNEPARSAHRPPRTRARQARRAAQRGAHSAELAELAAFSKSGRQ